MTYPATASTWFLIVKELYLPILLFVSVVGFTVVLGALIMQSRHRARTRLEKFNAYAISEIERRAAESGHRFG